MNRHYTVALYHLVFNRVVEKKAVLELAEAIKMVENGNKIHHLLRTVDQFRIQYAKSHKLTPAQVERLCTLQWVIQEFVRS